MAAPHKRPVSIPFQTSRLGGVATSFLPPPKAPPKGGRRIGIGEANKSLTPVRGAEGVLTFACASQGTEFSVFSGEAQPIISGGFGGITRVARPHRVALTDWQGVDPYTMVLAVRFDGWAVRQSMEPQIYDLLSMARDLSTRDGPPIISVSGPVPLPDNIAWLVDDVQWGNSLWEHVNHGGVPVAVPYRVRQDVVITLVEVEEADTVAFKSPAKKAAAAAKKPRQSTAKHRPKPQKLGGK
jgi:hypothetical protein